MKDEDLSDLLASVAEARAYARSQKAAQVEPDDVVQVKQSRHSARSFDSFPFPL